MKCSAVLHYKCVYMCVCVVCGAHFLMGKQLSLRTHGHSHEFCWKLSLKQVLCEEEEETQPDDSLTNCTLD